MRNWRFAIEPLVNSESTRGDNERKRNKRKRNSDFMSLDLDTDRLANATDCAGRCCCLRPRQLRCGFTCQHHLSCFSVRGAGTIELVLELEFLSECLEIKPQIFNDLISFFPIFSQRLRHNAHELGWSAGRHA